MKLIKFLALSLLVFSFISCKSDKDSNFTDAGIIGEWQLESGDFEGTLEVDGFNIHVSGYLKDINPSNRTNFKSDGTFNSFGGGFTMVITMDFMGTPITEEIETDEGFGHGTWTREGSSLIISDGEFDETMVYQIDKLTASQMILVTNFADLDEEFIGNVPFTFRFKKM